MRQLIDSIVKIKVQTELSKLEIKRIQDEAIQEIRQLKDEGVATIRRYASQFEKVGNSPAQPVKGDK